MKIDAYRDGGTVSIEYNDFELYIDNRIGTKTRGAIFLQYPNNKDAKPANGLLTLKKARIILKEAVKVSNFYNSTICLGLAWVEDVISNFNVIDYVRCTSINNRGTMNFQIDYSGMRQDCISSFGSWCKQNEIIWSHLFDERNGAKLASYDKVRGLITI